jgi:hypothetical protein
MNLLIFLCSLEMQICFIAIIYLRFETEIMYFGRHWLPVPDSPGARGA